MVKLSALSQILLKRDNYEETNKTNYYAMEQLMFHELGHCSLHLDHDDTKANGYPISIMNSKTFSSFYGLLDYYREHRNEYLNRM